MTIIDENGRPVNHAGEHAFKTGGNECLVCRTSRAEAHRVPCRDPGGVPGDEPSPNAGRKPRK